MPERINHFSITFRLHKPCIQQHFIIAVCNFIMQESGNTAGESELNMDCLRKSDYQ